MLVKSENKYELLRAIKELVLNANCHASCSLISITLTSELITIKDNGKGGVTNKINSYGLDGVRERLALIGLKLAITLDASGTMITISL
jgi:signal transduction histidine kinase